MTVGHNSERGVYLPASPTVPTVAIMYTLTLKVKLSVMKF